jgi:hypothetical protein
MTDDGMKREMRNVIPTTINWQLTTDNWQLTIVHYVHQLECSDMRGGDAYGGGETEETGQACYFDRRKEER